MFFDKIGLYLFLFHTHTHTTTMSKQINDFSGFKTDISNIKGGLRCPLYLVSAVRSKDPAALRRIIARFEEYSPETAVAVATAAETAGINLNAA